MATIQTPREETALVPKVLRVTGNGKANRAIENLTRGLVPAPAAIALCAVTLILASLSFAK